MAIWDDVENSERTEPEGQQPARDQELVRLELRLPADHPLFRYPPRSRTAVAKEWLDIGARLAAVEERLRAIEEKLASGVVLAQPVAGTEKQEEQVPAIDIDEFLKSFDA